MGVPQITTPKGYTVGSTSATDPAKLAANMTRELGKLERAQPNMRTVQITEDYTVDPRDRIILADTSAGQVNISLRSATLPLVLPLTIIKTSDDANAVLVAAPSGELINLGEFGTAASFQWDVVGEGWTLHPDGLGTWWIQFNAVRLGSSGSSTAATLANTLAALNAIGDGVADTVPYFTGIATAALASLTPYARTILACANASSARTVLGLGTLATLSTVTESNITLADVTTLNVSTTKHGLAPKGTGTGTKYLDDTGAYTTPAGGGTYPPALPTFPVLTTGGASYQGRFSAETTVSAITKDNDGFVSNITDSTGNWGSAMTATTTARPRWVKKGMLWMRPGFVFDGTLAKMVAGATKVLAQPFTVVAVVQDWVSGSANNNVFRDSAGGPVLFINTSNAHAIFAGSTLQSTTTFSNTKDKVPQGRTGMPAVICAVFNGASSILRVNGTEVTGAAGAMGISGTMNFGGDQSTSKMNGVIYELVFISGACNATDRAAFDTYYFTALDLT